MTSTFTPGPWIAEEGVGKGAWIKGASEEWSALACGDTHETANANARLIAAAPELLELACQYRDDLRRPPSPESIERRLTRIADIIAKATGAA